jgi:hypothetical protein
LIDSCLIGHPWSPWGIAILKLPILAQRRRVTTERAVVE